MKLPRRKWHRKPFTTIKQSGKLYDRRKFKDRLKEDLEDHEFQEHFKNAAMKLTANLTQKKFVFYGDANYIFIVGVV